MEMIGFIAASFIFLICVWVMVGAFELATRFGIWVAFKIGTLFMSSEEKAKYKEMHNG